MVYDDTECDLCSLHNIGTISAVSTNGPSGQGHNVVGLARGQHGRQPVMGKSPSRSLRLHQGRASVQCL